MLLWTGAVVYGGTPGKGSPPSVLPKSIEFVDVAVAGSSAALYLQGREASG
jgi:hypothetical protein